MNWNLYRTGMDGAIDLVAAYKDYWALEGNLSAFEDVYLVSLMNLKKITSRQVAAKAIVDCAMFYRLSKKAVF